MDLKKIKYDRDNSVIISRCTWDSVLDRAIELEYAKITGAINPNRMLTDEQISKGGRYLSDTSAEACNVDKDDNWKVYGQEYIYEFHHAFVAAIGKPDGEGA